MHGWAIGVGLDPVGRAPPLGTGAVQIIHQAQLPMGSGTFVRTAAVYALLQILLAIGYAMTSL